MRCFYCMEEYDEDLDVICPFCGNDVVSPTNDSNCLSAGSVLKQRYVLGRVLGDGGFGITYIGYDKALKRKVAVKEFFPNECATRQSGDTQVTPLSGERGERYMNGLKSFQEEAQRLANLGSVEGVVNVYDVFADNGTAYIVMEYLSGDTVAQMVEKSKSLGFGKTMNIIVPVLRSLVKIHKAGIIHRDISPQNIIRTKEGKIVLIDFGAARQNSFSMSKSVSIILKQGYAPIEQYDNKLEQNSWTDVYAVAATMYYMLTGVTPDFANSRLLTDTLVPISELKEGLPPQLDGFLQKALAVRPEDRTQTAQELLDQLMTLKDFKKDSSKKKTKNPEKVATQRIQKGQWKSYVGNTPPVDGVTPNEMEYRPTVITIDRVPPIQQEPIDEPIDVPKKKTRVSVPLVILTILAVLVLGALVAVGYIDRQNNIEVPNFIGQNIDDVLSDSEYEFDFNIVNIYNPDTDLDIILDQTPVSSGSHRVKKDSEVRLTVNSLDTEVTVPVLSKMSQSVAVSTLKSMNLESEIVLVHNDDYDEGTVIKTEPSNGEKVKVCSTVKVYIAENSVAVPNVIGKTYEEAAAELEAVGLHAGEATYDYSEEYDTGCIMGQGIKQDVLVEKDTYISLVVSQGRPYDVTLSQTVDVSEFKTPFKISVMVDGAEEAKKTFYSLLFRKTYDFEVVRLNTTGVKTVEVYIDGELYQTYEFDFRNGYVTLIETYEISAAKASSDDDETASDSDTESDSSKVNTESTSSSNTSSNTSSEEENTSSAVSSNNSDVPTVAFPLETSSDDVLSD